MNSRTHYDVAIIGAGLSGIAAGIRSALFGKSVCIFERHNAPGGLNSFYSVGGRKFDVGLHAVTNFVPPAVRNAPLSRILRQLRIDRGEWALREQKRSRIAFGPAGETCLAFTNQPEIFESEVARLFPKEIDGLRRLTALVRETAYAPDAPRESARAVIGRHLADPMLRDLILCPVLFYGSAWENDLDFQAAALLYHAIFLEGFARPWEGVRRILRVLLDKYRAAGGERRMKCGVRRILSRGGRATALVLDDGAEITAERIVSCIGGPETAALMPEAAPQPPPRPGALAFVETISVLRSPPAALGWGEDTIVFFNDSDRLRYENPREAVDVRSGVLCLPNNFQYTADEPMPEGQLRVTCLANYAHWKSLAPDAYQAEKRRWFGRVQASGQRFLPPVGAEALAAATVATDMFTPTTVERYTWRRGGAIYGSPDKSMSGATPLSNVFLCGTDQGYVGIIGALLSGVIIANRHVLGAPAPAAVP